MPLQKQPKSARNPFTALQTRRMANEGYKLHLQYARLGDCLRAPRIVLKALNRRFKERSDSFYWRWGAQWYTEGLFNALSSLGSLRTYCG